MALFQALYAMPDLSLTLHKSQQLRPAPASLDASSLIQLYSSLCASPIHSSNTPQLSQQADADQYGKGLAAAADLQAKAVKPDRTSAREVATRGLADWLQGKQNACHRTVLTVIPEDSLQQKRLEIWTGSDSCVTGWSNRTGDRHVARERELARGCPTSSIMVFHHGIEMPEEATIG
ncbi:MAG: hypothetical protein FRX49_04880 [Trebouxia sp. A1-2]|nr:MAG: hypothetical protein FRX49_04880 [Trebouxia sp. A1-2]